MKIRNPRTGVYDHEIAPLDTVAVENAAQHLRVRQKHWGALSPDRRSAVLVAFADAVESHSVSIAAALAIDTGRQAISQIEVDGTIGAIRRWAARAPGLIAAASPCDQPTAIPTIATSTRLVPYPLVGVISPWNFPLTLALIDAIPALAAGCAVIVKPSEITPRFIGPLMAAIAEVPELPLLVIEGDGATGAALVRAVDFIAFTGSVATGRKVAAAAAEAFIPASLELGGKDPMIVLASADPVAAAHTALRASIVNTGQACQSIERVLVARSIYEPFIAALVNAAKSVRPNFPDIAVGDIGPFIFDKQAAIVQAQIDDAVAGGATVLAGGQIETMGGGLYLRPTVLTGVTPAMTLMREETFGPVIPVTVFENVEDAISDANASHFGLSAAVLAGTVEEAEAVAVRLEAGAVSINDGSLTAMVWEVEKTSFGASGMGPSRMGDSGLLRFFRKQAIIRQSGSALPISTYAEDAQR
ncbi:aldehyde dehydrogenase family protein [Sphingomonas sp. SUN039]|uniref:aldehyde dehydrogenase family protein n=1 Tax=Sphingomonas sp. SUN039 TaxID=2937787 RepID=UPI002164136C|nr:aldehyde dehydrogenase family protein [Sphingomonas sp. SUN039]UVO55733.1 aldehyde dehydrogenase family protein [Sphingomonas sp. SUN039]